MQILIGRIDIEIYTTPKMYLVVSRVILGLLHLIIRQNKPDRSVATCLNFDASPRAHGPVLDVVAKIRVVPSNPNYVRSITCVKPLELIGIGLAAVSDIKPDSLTQCLFGV